MMTPEHAELLAQQRAAARRAHGQGRRWYLRAALMVVIAGIALYRGGQLNVVVGAGLLGLALLSASLGRQLRRQAAEMEAKIDLMEHTSSAELGELAG